MERFAPWSWTGFYVELARLGGPTGVLTLLTIARIDADGTGHIDEEELKTFEKVADKLVRETCDALQMSAVVASLLFGATFQTVIGRPQIFEASEASVLYFGDVSAEVLMWLAYSAMSLISTLCLIIIAFAFGSRTELQNVLPSTQSRLFFLCEVNPMNIVTSLVMFCLILFLFLALTAGILASPTRGFFTASSFPLLFAIAHPLWQGMRNGPIRLRLEARAFLGIENQKEDLVTYGRRKTHSKACRLKHYLASHSSCASVHTLVPPPKMLSVVNQAILAAKEEQIETKDSGGPQANDTGRGLAPTLDSLREESEEGGGA